MTKCDICRARDSVRTLGTVSYCFECAELFLAPLRDKYKPLDLKNAVIDRKADDQGNYHMHCVTCQAKWVGDGYGECKWCADRDARKRGYVRKDLLFPTRDDLHNE